jgi:hypothetical protein
MASNPDAAVRYPHLSPKSNRSERWMDVRRGCSSKADCERKTGFRTRSGIPIGSLAADAEPVECEKWVSTAMHVH